MEKDNEPAVLRATWYVIGGFVVAVSYGTIFGVDRELGNRIGMLVILGFIVLIWAAVREARLTAQWQARQKQESSEARAEASSASQKP